jgi:two-component system sensor kinase FixL
VITDVNVSEFEAKSKFRDRHAVIIIFIVIALSASLIDVMIDAFVYHYGSFWDVLVSSSPGIIYGRIYIAASFIVIGVIMDLYMGARARLMQRRAKEKLEASEKKYQTLCDEGRFVILRIDRKGTVKYVNKIIEEFGLKRDEVIGSNMLKFIPMRKRPKLFNVHLGVMRGNNAEGETELITPIGKRFVEYASNPIKEDGKIIGCETLIRDITEKKEMERKLHEYATQLESKIQERTIELRASRDELAHYSEHLEELIEKRTEQLRKAERMAAIGELATIVAHDLRNPLQGIGNGVHYLKSKLHPTDENVMRIMDLIENDIRYSEEILRELLDYSAEIYLELSETTPRTIVEEAIASVTIPESIQVLNETDQQIRIMVDARKILRVFTNIVKNAIEAMPQGGILRVRCKSVKGEAVFAFSDTGVGIPPESIGKIWTPFFTSKAKGIGLSLSISKRIVEAHGGSISVKSTLGKGSTFTVIIPQRKESSARETVLIKGTATEETVAQKYVAKTEGMNQ